MLISSPYSGGHSLLGADIQSSNTGWRSAVLHSSSGGVQAMLSLHLSNPHLANMHEALAKIELVYLTPRPGHPLIGGTAHVHHALVQFVRDPSLVEGGGP